MKSFLIVKTSAIGDVIQTFPVLAYLRKKFPDSQIHWLVEKACSGLVSAHPMIDHVISLDTKNWKKKLHDRKTWQEIVHFRKEIRKTVYDVVFDFQANIKSGFLCYDTEAKEKVGYSWSTVSEKPNVLFTSKRYAVDTSQNIRKQYLDLVMQYVGKREEYVEEPVLLRLTEEETERLDRFVDTLPIRTSFMVAFGSKWANKQLPLASWISFLNQIKERVDPYFLFVFGNKEEEQIARELHSNFGSNDSVCVGGMSLPYWQRLMYKVDGVLSVDSAALHLCGTTTTPSFGIFGPSHSSVYKPLGLKSYSVQGQCPYGKAFEKRCPILRSCNSGACIQEIATPTLVEQFDRWFSDRVRTTKADRSRYADLLQRQPR